MGRFCRVAQWLLVKSRFIASCSLCNIIYDQNFNENSSLRSHHHRLLQLTNWGYVGGGDFAF